MECNIKQNMKNCNCSYNPCSRKGKCCECIAFHKNSGELPACFFTKEYERTYNRSVENFIKQQEK